MESGGIGKSDGGKREREEEQPKTDEKEKEKEEEEALFAFKLFSSAPAATSIGGAHDTPLATSEGRITSVEDSERASQLQPPEPTQDISGVQYIRLSPPPTSSSTGLHAKTYPIPTRPLSYYITDPSSSSKLAEYASAALTGDFILNTLSKQPWPGMLYPWRITHISSSALPTTTRITSTHNTIHTTLPETKRKRTRLGKKSRIKIRIRHELKKRKQEEKNKEEEAREAHLREKKTRVNRLKQLKKREKGRVIKGVGGEGSVVDGEVADSMVDGD